MHAVPRVLELLFTGAFCRRGNALRCVGLQGVGARGMWSGAIDRVVKRFAGVHWSFSSCSCVNASESWREI